MRLSRVILNRMILTCPSDMILPENILRCMSAKERKAIGAGAMTSSEANAVYEDRLEKELHKLINGYLRQRGIVPGHQRMDKKSNMKAGYPDFVFVVRDSNLKPVPIAIEAKVGKNVLTDDQVNVMKQMIMNGWSYFLVRSLQELKEILDGITEQ